MLKKVKNFFGHPPNFLFAKISSFKVLFFQIICIHPLRAIFHHEDEGNYSLLSYEARVHDFEIIGANKGSAKKCVKCVAGTFLDHNGAYCQKCPNGTYSDDGQTECTRCKDGWFADKEGSPKCTKCGAGTTSNKNRDGCDYKNCRFHSPKGYTYDLLPLRVVNGPMYKVQTHRPKSKYFFPLFYYINICSLKHDNSSCTSIKRVPGPAKKTTVRKKVSRINGHSI